MEDTTTVTILATTYYGARHGLESLSQLIAFDEDSNSLQIVKDAKINDAPKFKWVGSKESFAHSSNKICKLILLLF